MSTTFCMHVFNTGKITGIVIVLFTTELPIKCHNSFMSTKPHSMHVFDAGRKRLLYSNCSIYNETMQ